MAKRPKHDDKFRASAVVMLQAAGWPNQEGALTRTAQHLGISHTTLRRWANGESNPPPDEIVQEKRKEFSDLLEDEIRAAIKAMDSVRADASYRDLGTVVGILTDKRQLLSGQPTENNQTRIRIEYADIDIDPTKTALESGEGDS